MDQQIDKGAVNPPKKHIISIGHLQPDKVLTLSGIQVTLKYIPSGEYWMGSCESEMDHQEDETPHKVSIIQGFYMISTPVTQGLYQAVTGKNPSQFKGTECPVERVSWEDARAFASKVSALVGGRWELPTEAQWEWAARGGEEYMYAGSDDLNEVGWYRDNSGSTTHPVQQKKPNGFGLYDMSGNIWEWTAVKEDNGAYRVLRGGSWRSVALAMRIATRSKRAPSLRDVYYGFRLVRS